MSNIEKLPNNTNEQPPVIEHIRRQMTEADIYAADDPNADPLHPAYSLGVWLPTDSKPGKVIGEEQVPDQELLTEDFSGNQSRDYFAGSNVINDYMTYGILAGAMEGPLRDPLQGLGYQSAKFAASKNGSNMYMSSFTGIEQANNILSATGNSEVKLIDQPDAVTGKKLVESYAEGLLPISSTSDLLTQAPLWGLLPPELHAEYKNLAQSALQSGDPEQIRRAQNTLSSLTLLNKGRLLADAFEDTEDQGFSPTKIDELGYELNNQLTDYGRQPDLEDHGRSLAEKTVTHMRRLASHLVEVPSETE